MPGQHCNSCSSLSRRKREEKGRRIASEEAFLFFCMILKKKRGPGLTKKPVFQPMVMLFLHGLLERVCFAIVEKAEEI